MFSPQEKENELLPIVVQKDNVLVDARLLHQQLQSGTPFTQWIKRRIDDYEFEKGKDFFTNLLKTPGGGRSTEEYLISLDMAKELAMLERNEAGRHVRHYFIRREKELRGLTILTPDEELFKNLKAKSLNNRKLYPYKEILRRCGYSLKSGSDKRKARYAQHFVLMDNLLFITEEYAVHLYHQMRVIKNRFAIQAMQPVLPENFGEPITEEGGAA